MNGFGQCQRCGNWSVEHLRFHSHCWECGSSPEEFGAKKIYKPKNTLIRNTFGGFAYTKIYA